MSFDSKALCNYIIVHTNQGRTYQIFFHLNLLLDGIQDDFVSSFRKKEMYLYFQLENILRLFEVMKMIFKKCIRIVKSQGDIQPDIHDVCQVCYQMLIQIFV